MRVNGVARRHLGHWRAHVRAITVHAEDVNAALFAVALGDVCEPHLVRQGVDDATLCRRQRGRHCQILTRWVCLEDGQLGVEFEHDGVVQVIIYFLPMVSKGDEGRGVSIPSLRFWFETGEGEVPGTGPEDMEPREG